jgi:hypothetical protein
MSRNLTAALACLLGIALITFVSASGIGFSTQVKTAESLPASQVMKVLDEGQPGYGRQDWLALQSITYRNAFLPRQVLLPQVTACFYNSTSGHGVHASTRWTPQNGAAYADVFPDGNVVRLGLGETSITLELQPWIVYRGSIYVTPVQGEPRPAKPVPAAGEPELYDTLYLFKQEIRGFRDYAYTPCENLQAGDLARAEKIVLN